MFSALSNDFSAAQFLTVLFIGVPQVNETFEPTVTVAFSGGCVILSAVVEAAIKTPVNITEHT